MTYIVQNIKLSIETSKDEALAMARHRLLKFFTPNSIKELRIYKTSIDARKKDNILFVYSVAAEIHGCPRSNENVLFSMPPRKNTSSILTFHARRVRMTLSCAGAFRAVTRAVRIGTASLGNLCCMMEMVCSNFAKGPSCRGLFAFSRSCFSKACKPCSR